MVKDSLEALTCVGFSKEQGATCVPVVTWVLVLGFEGCVGAVRKLFHFREMPLKRGLKMGLVLGVYRIGIVLRGRLGLACVPYHWV